MLMLDLFAGLGGASAAFRDRGWEVVTVDADPAFGCTATADLSSWSWGGPPPDLVWASPPCTEFARELMPWSRTGREPSLVLVEAALRIVRECSPRWWALENVRGATKYLNPLMGEPKVASGPFFLWGKFPPFRAKFRGRKKESYSSKAKAERAKVPYAVSLGLCLACERTLF